MSVFPALPSQILEAQTHAKLKKVFAKAAIEESNGWQLPWHDFVSQYDGKGNISHSLKKICFFFIFLPMTAITITTSYASNICSIATLYTFPVPKKV